MVWLSQDARGTPIVIKLLRPTFASRPSGQAAFGRLQATVHLHKNLIHDSLARVYGTVVDPMSGGYAMLSQYVDGRLLSHVQLPPAALKGHEPKSLAVLLTWFESLTDVMAWLHTQGIIHGNLKPSNVMLMRAGHGHISCVLDLSWSSIGLAAPAPGTPTYLAPEQVRGASPTEASDQWSIAKMLAEILSPTGEPLTLGALPAVLVMSVQRALAPDPAGRFDTMMEFTSSLRAIRLELERSGTPVPTSRPELGSSRPQSFTEEPETELQDNPIPSDRYDTPILRTAPPRESSMPPVPSARKMIPAADTGDFPTNGADEGPSFGGLDSLPMDDTFHPGSLESPSVGDEPALSFDALHISDDGIPAEAFSGEGAFEAAPLETGPSLTAPSHTPPPQITTTPEPTKKRKYLAVYGFLLMFLAGAIAVGAIKFVGDGMAGLSHHDTAPPPPPAAPPEPIAVDDPPVEDPPPVDTTPPPPPPPVVEEAPPPPVVEKAPPPPPPKKDVEEPPPPTRKPATEDDDDEPDIDLDRALAKLDAAPPPPAASGFDAREASVGCDEGDADACVELARYLLDEKGAAFEAANTFKRACEFGKAVGCQEAGLLVAKSGKPEDKKEAARLHEKACAQKLSAGCHAAALLTEDPEAARALEAKACALGRKSSCAAATKAAPPPPPAKKDDDGSLDEKLDDDEGKAKTSTSA